MNFQDRLRKLREQAGLSQADVAGRIGIARATYASLEAGRRSPNLDELQKISQLYELSIAELIQSGESKVSEPVVAYARDETTEEIVPREIDPQVKPEKLREVLLYILARVGAKPNIGETVLYKLLYFIDMDYYEKTGHSVTGLTYIRNHFGPTPTIDFRAVVEDMQHHDELVIVENKYFNATQKKYLPNAYPNLEKISAAELKHIDEELARLSDKSAKELSEFSHYDTPWLAAQPGQPIDYRSVFYRSSITAVIEPDDEL